MKLTFKWILYCVSISFLVACGGGGGGSNDSVPNNTIDTNTNNNTSVVSTTLDSISVTPASSTVAINGTVQMVATGNFSDGASDDISATVTWSVDNPSVASISSIGLVTGVSGGTVTVSAVDGSITGVATVTVTDPGTPPPSSSTPELQISEISSGSSSNGFWFELYNPTDIAVELSAFTLKSRNNQTGADVNLSLPNKLVPAGAYLVLMTEDLFASAPSASYLDNPNVVILENADYSWNTSGYLELLDNGETMDFVRFGNNSQLPTSAGAWDNGSAPSFTFIDYNQSIARDGLNTDSDSANDWILRDFSSMGGPNDISCADDTDQDGIPDCSEVPGSTYAGMDLYT